MNYLINQERPKQWVLHSRKHFHLLDSLIVWLVYGIHIIFTTPKLVNDAIMFNGNAAIFLREGFGFSLISAYPVAEIGYPFFLASVMKVTPSILEAQVIISLQYLMLYFSAIMLRNVLRVMMESEITQRICFFAVAISPALVSASAGYYSEVFSMFWFVLWIYSFWKWVGDINNRRNTIQWIILGGISFGILSVTRGAFLYICTATVGFWLLVKMLIMKEKLASWAILLYVMACLALPLAWSARNAWVYGIPQVADPSRNAVVLAGRFAKSQEKYSIRDFAAGTLNAVSERGARFIFGNTERYTWFYANSLGYQRMQQHMSSAGKSSEDEARRLEKQTMFDIVTINPVRFMLFGWFELVQLLFFETLMYDSVEIKLSILRVICDNVLLHALVHLGLSSIYLSGLGMLIWHVFFGLHGSRLSREQKITLLILGIPLVLFFIIYSIATCVIRYTFVVAPVYIGLAVVGWFLSLDPLRKNFIVHKVENMKNTSKT